MSRGVELGAGGGEAGVESVGRGAGGGRGGCKRGVQGGDEGEGAASAAAVIRERRRIGSSWAGDGSSATLGPGWDRNPKDSARSSPGHRSQGFPM